MVSHTHTSAIYSLANIYLNRSSQALLKKSGVEGGGRKGKKNRKKKKKKTLAFY